MLSNMEKQIRQAVSSWGKPILFFIFVYISAYFIISRNLYVNTPSTLSKYTIRVNTFRRLDSLERFLDHYRTCPMVQQLQVVWSDQENKPPMDWLDKYSPNSDKIVFEVHDANSLSNRFIAVLPIHTEAVLSIDDDLIVSCDELDHAHRIWTASKRSLVGFSPRLAAKSAMEGNSLYLRWQHTWWSGLYSIILTKDSFLHSELLRHYENIVPKSFLSYIDTHRNCEDIAMAYVAAAMSESRPPVWVQGFVEETSSSGISSGATHFVERGKCLDVLMEHIPLSHNKMETLSSWKPWFIGYQKAKRISMLSDFWDLVIRAY